MSANQDAEHLQLLSIFYYINAGLTALFACIPIIHVVLGLGMIFFPEKFGSDQPPAFIGWLFALIGLLLILMGWALAVLSFCVARFLKARKHYTFCMVIAGIECLFFPIGTALGIFTILVLQRPSVKAMFDRPVATP